MTDQHIIVIATIVQCLLLLVSALLISWYLLETWRLRKVAEEQAEASFRPAIVAKARGSLSAAPHLVNIGNGPAIEVSWRLLNSEFEGTLPYMEPRTLVELPMDGMKPLYEAGAKVEPNAPSVECTHKSLSGRSYSSSNSYKIDRDQFSTSFKNR